MVKKGVREQFKHTNSCLWYKVTVTTLRLVELSSDREGERRWGSERCFAQSIRRFLQVKPGHC